MPMEILLAPNVKKCQKNPNELEQKNATILKKTMAFQQQQLKQIQSLTILSHNMGAMSSTLYSLPKILLYASSAMI